MRLMVVVLSIHVINCWGGTSKTLDLTERGCGSLLKHSFTGVKATTTRDFPFLKVYINGSYAWCPFTNDIPSDSLAIDVAYKYKISELEIQGKEAGKGYPTTFSLRYSENKEDYETIMEGQNPKKFTVGKAVGGNGDDITRVILPYVITARVISIFDIDGQPVGGESSDRKCLRADVYGCPLNAVIDLVFAISASSTQSSTLFGKMKENINGVIDRYGLATSYWRYSVLAYSSTVNTVVSFNSSFSNDSQLKAAVSSAIMPSGVPDLNAALTSAENLLTSRAAGATAIKMICVMADKQSGSNLTVLSTTVRRIVNKGIKIIGVTVGLDSSEQEMKQILSNDWNYIDLKNPYWFLRYRIDRIVKKILSNIYGCAKFGCFNGGTCRDTKLGDGFTCTCPMGFYGTRCEIGPKVDLTFAMSAVDISSGQINWEIFLQTINTMVERYGVINTQYSIIVFGSSSQARVTFANKFTSVTSLKSYITSHVKRLTGGPNLSATLSTASRVIFGTGSRSGIPKVLVLMIDKKSKSISVQKEINSIAFNGVKVIGVAMGNDTDLKNEIVSVITNENNLLTLNPQMDVKTNADQLSRKIVYNLFGCGGNPCLNGGTCHGLVDGDSFTCSCMIGYTGNTCLKGPQIDMLYLVSAAASTSAFRNFEIMKNVTKRFISQYHRDSIKYSYLTYGSQVVTTVKFDDVITSDDELRSIIATTAIPSGPPVLDRALVEASKVLYGVGSRPSADKLLVLMMDAKWASSNADVYTAAKQLIDKGVKVIAVSFSNEIKATELSIITENVVTTDFTQNVSTISLTLEKEVVEVTAGCRSRPCQNGGMCSETKTATLFACACLSGYDGERCELADCGTMVGRSATTVSSSTTKQKPLQKPLINGDYAWCPETNKIASDGITVDFGEPVFVSKIGVQGRNDGKGYPTSFLVKHSLGGNMYNDISEGGNPKRFKRSSSITKASDYDLVSLERTIQLRYLTLYSIEGKVGVYGADDDMKCLRFDIHGCFPGKKIDLAFSLSATSANADQNFQLMRLVISNLINSYGLGNTQYASLAYGSNVKVKLQYNDTFKTTQDMISFFNSTTRVSGTPILHQALADSKSLILGKGSRNSAFKVLVVFQDGKSASTSEDISTASTILRNYGIKIITVSLGNNASSDLAKVFQTVIDGSIQNLTETIKAKIAEATSGCGVSPCLNGGKCITGKSVEKYSCACAGMFSGTNCEIGPDVDLAFAISANAGNATETFKKMKEVINGVINTYGTGSFRYSVIVHGTNATSGLRFNDEFRTNILLKVDHVGSSYLASRAVSSCYGVGTRPRASKLLVLMTDTQSEISVDQLRQSSREMIDRGTKVIAVNNGNNLEMLNIRRLLNKDENMISGRGAEADVYNLLIKKITSVIYGCGSDPCLNGGDCVEAQNGKSYSCRCREPFQGKRCENGPQVDVSFSISATGVNADNDFGKMKDVLVRLTDGYGRQNFRYGLVNYGTAVNITSNLNNIMLTDNDLKYSLQAIQREKGTPLITMSLDATKLVLFGGSSRPNARKIAVFLLNNRGNVSEYEVKQKLNELKRKETTVLVCVLGGKTNIPNGIPGSDVIIIGTGDTPVDIASKIRKEIDKIIIGCSTSNPCLNDGVCRADRRCECVPGTIGVLCQYGCKLVELGVAVNNPRGLRVADVQMTSSSKHSLYYGAYRARINLQSVGPWKNSWCSQKLDKSPYLEIDFEVTVTIKVIETAGVASFEGKEAYVNLFSLSYKLKDGESWKEYKDSKGVVKKFTANRKKTNHTIEDLDTRFIRLRPLSSVNHICLQVAVFGCSVDYLGGVPIRPGGLLSSESDSLTNPGSRVSLLGDTGLWAAPLAVFVFLLTVIGGVAAGLYAKSRCQGSTNTNVYHQAKDLGREMQAFEIEFGPEKSIDFNETIEAKIDLSESALLQESGFISAYNEVEKAKRTSSGAHDYRLFGETGKRDSKRNKPKTHNNYEEIMLVDKDGGLTNNGFVSDKKRNDMPNIRSQSMSSGSHSLANRNGGNRSLSVSSERSSCNSSLHELSVDDELTDGGVYYRSPRSTFSKKDAEIVKRKLNNDSSSGNTVNGLSQEEQYTSLTVAVESLAQQRAKVHNDMVMKRASDNAADEIDKSQNEAAFFLNGKANSIDFKLDVKSGNSGHVTNKQFIIEKIEREATGHPTFSLNDNDLVMMTSNGELVENGGTLEIRKSYIPEDIFEPENKILCFDHGTKKGE